MAAQGRKMYFFNIIIFNGELNEFSISFNLIFFYYAFALFEH